MIWLYSPGRRVSRSLIARFSFLAPRPPAMAFGSKVIVSQVLTLIPIPAAPSTTWSMTR